MALSSTARGNRRHAEKRKEGRSYTTLTGRLYFPDRDLEDACQIVDLSPSGARLKTTASSPIGTRVVLYAEEFGRYEGAVVWRDRAMLGMEFRCSQARRKRTAEQLATFLASGGKVGLDLRRTTRVQQPPDLNQVVTSSGEYMPCEVMNIALGGAALKSTSRPAVGEIVQFGECSARVIRHSLDGFIVEFSREQIP